MTSRERAEKLVENWLSLYPQLRMYLDSRRCLEENIHAALDEAVAEEREACAMAATECWLDHDRPTPGQVAAAIRARKEKP